jgi:hypothetical protein
MAYHLAIRRLVVPALNEPYHLDKPNSCEQNQFVCEFRKYFLVILY